MVGQEDEVFYENKEVNCIYFLKEGSCGFVLSKKYNQAKYIDIPPGCTFGIIDIIGSILLMDEGEVDGDSFQEKYENWIYLKGRLKRQFSVKTQDNCELMTLSVEDLQRMKFEFCESYESLMSSAFFRLTRASKLKINATKYCDKYMFEDGEAEVVSKSAMLKQSALGMST